MLKLKVVLDHTTGIGYPTAQYDCKSRAVAELRYTTINTPALKAGFLSSYPIPNSRARIFRQFEPLAGPYSSVAHDCCVARKPLRDHGQLHRDRQELHENLHT